MFEIFREKNLHNSNSNKISTTSFSKPEIIRTNSKSPIREELVNKPLNLYYLNYFNHRKNINDNNKTLTNHVRTKSLYEQAAEELKQNEQINETATKLSHIPLKFCEIDYETSQNPHEITAKPMIFSKKISENQKINNKKNKTPDKNPRKLIISYSNTKPEKSTKSVSKQKLSTTSKKQINFNTTTTKKTSKTPLKNVNNEKGLIDFSLESEHKATNIVANILKTPTKSEILNKNLLENSVIKIIPKSLQQKNSENNHKLSQKTSSKLSYTEVLTSNNMYNKPDFRKTNESSSLIPLNRKEISSYYLLKELQDQNSDKKNSINLSKPKILVPFQQEMSKEHEIIENLALQASYNLENLIKDPSASINIQESSNNFKITDKKTQEMLDENFPLNVSESLSLNNLDHENKESEKFVVHSSQRTSRKHKIFEEIEENNIGSSQKNQLKKQEESIHNSQKEQNKVLQENFNEKNMEKSHKPEDNNINIMKPESNKLLQSKSSKNNNNITENSEKNNENNENIELPKENSIKKKENPIINSLKKDQEQLSRLFSFDNKYNFSAETPRLQNPKELVAIPEIKTLSNATIKEEIEAKSMYDIKNYTNESGFKKMPLNEKSKTENPFLENQKNFMQTISELNIPPPPDVKRNTSESSPFNKPLSYEDKKLDLL